MCLWCVLRCVVRGGCVCVCVCESQKKSGWLSYILIRSHWRYLYSSCLTVSKKLDFLMLLSLQSLQIQCHTVHISLQCSFSVQYQAHKRIGLHTHRPIKAVILRWLSQESSGIFAQRWISAHSDCVTTAGALGRRKTAHQSSGWHMADTSDESGWIWG